MAQRNALMGIGARPVNDVPNALIDLYGDVAPRKQYGPPIDLNDLPTDYNDMPADAPRDWHGRINELARIMNDLRARELAAKPPRWR